MKCAYNKRSGIVIGVAFVVCMLAAQIQAGIAVKIFSREESLTEFNMSKPNIYIQNTGTVALSGLKFYYHFTTENGKVPMLDRYYIPGFSVNVVTVSTGNYKLEYSLTGTLAAGAVVPGTGGSSVGLHYNTWDAWDKTNDYSNNRLTAFAENPSIPVYYMGTKIYGNEPGGGSTTPPEAPEADIRLNSFALYSTQQTTIKERSVFSGGGAVGSNGIVEIKDSAVINGNVVSGGNAILWSNIVIDGDITLGGILIQQGIGNTFASLTTGANVATLTLPDYSVTTNTNNITVNQDLTLPLAPGIYGDLYLMQRATVKLDPGNYTFRKFYIENGAKVIFMIGNYQDQIEISSSGEFDIQDNAELKFNTLSYAPSVRIYSRDPNTLRIGVDAKTAGIITAPFATVNMYTGARCDGAIYAKNINVEPGAIINSAYVDPNRDDDGDGVPNGIEVEIPTNPTDPTSYVPVAIPDNVLIDNTGTTVIKYKVNRFYSAYPSQATIILVCPPGSLRDPTKAPIIQLSAEEPSGLPAHSGYVPVGMYVQIKSNQVNVGKQIYAGIPMPGNSTGTFDMALHTPGATAWTTFQYPYSFLSALSDEDRNLLMDSTDAIAMISHSDETNTIGTMVATWKNSGSAVAYFDDGTVFSSKNGSEIDINMTLTDITGLDPVHPAKVIIKYTDLLHPSTVIPPVELNFTRSGDVISCVDAIAATNNGIRLDSVIVKTRSSSGSEVTVLSKSPALEAVQSESFYLHASCKVADINKDKNFSIYKVATMAFESAPLAGDGLITKEGADFKYNYFLKDHLGSTRMVLDENGGVKEALMYQHYGTVSDVQGITAPATDPLRQKFTTKEFDEEGDANSAPGIKAYYFGARFYDPEAGIWTSVDPKHQFINPYSYCTNPLIFVDKDGKVFFLLPIIISAAANAAIDIGLQLAANGGHFDQIAWGSVASSAAIGGVSAGLGQAFAAANALGKGLGAGTIFAQQTFGGFMARNALNSAISVPIQMAGLAFDQSRGMRKNENFRSTMLNTGLSFGANTLIGGFSATFSRSHLWDPGFNNMIKSQQLAQQMGYNRLFAWSPPERFFEKTPYGFTNSSDSRIPIVDEFKSSAIRNPQLYLQFNLQYKKEQNQQQSWDGTIELQPQNYPPDW